MPEYQFNVKETYRGTIIVEADTLEEARRKYARGEAGDISATGERCNWEITSDGREVE